MIPPSMRTKQFWGHILVSVSSLGVLLVAIDAYGVAASWAFWLGAGWMILVRQSVAWFQGWLEAEINAEGPVPDERGTTEVVGTILMFVAMLLVVIGLTATLAVGGFAP